MNLRSGLRFFTTLLALAAGWGLAGCQAPQVESRFSDVPAAIIEEPSVSGGTNAVAAIAPPTPVALTMPPAGPLEPNLDVLRANEQILITFSDLPYLQQPIEERIKEDGTITLLQNQTFVAAGKTRSDLEREIRARYVPKYYVNMTVSVKQAENTQFYFVGGEVRAPGRQVYIGRMTVLKAIKSCGDFTDFANKKKVLLTRSSGDTFIVDAKKALRNPKLDLEVYPGDTVHVPRSIL